MEASALYDQLTQELQITKLHPLHKAMLEECCETALKSTTERDPRMLKLAVQTAFVTSNATLRGMLKASLKVGDVINLNYRGQTFVINKDSPLLADV